jgi:uncharacterized protein YecE (DUF72 family)
MAKHGTVRIGVSGWLYRPWRGAFYPKKLPQSQELAHIGCTFPTVEINGSFYRTQKAHSYAHWREVVPGDFVFAVKGPRFLTHMLRLKNVETPLANFMASGVLALREKLGPILWQLPPTFRYDQARLETFFALLPHDTKAAMRLAHRHDARVKEIWLGKVESRVMRHAIEIRHDSFIDPAFVAQLRAHNIALVCADTVKWPRLMDVTADFVYCRLHGSTELYRSNYDARALGQWARRAAAWARGEDVTGRHASPKLARKAAGRDVFIYFDNTDKLHAPQNALDLTARMAALLDAPAKR